MRNASWVIVSALLFVASAKAHGRELRLERVAAGVRDVVFGGANPPFVEGLWRAERVRFWVAMPIAALLIGAVLHIRGQHGWVAAVGGLTFGSSAAFTILGALSLQRAGGDRGEIGASLFWWGVVALFAFVSMLALPSAKESST